MRAGFRMTIARHRMGPIEHPVFAARPDTSSSPEAALRARTTVEAPSLEREDAALRALEARAIAGDGSALDQVWRRHRPWVAAVMLAHKSSRDDLEDLLQEVATTLVDRVDSVRDPLRFRGWLRMVAINAARASARAGRIRPVPVSGELCEGATARNGTVARPGESGPGASLEQRDGVDRLSARLEALPEIYREPLLLRVVRGLTSRQVAEMLGVNPATVDTRVARARRMLFDAATDGSSALPDRFATARGGTRGERRSASSPGEGNTHHDQRTT